MDGEAWGWTGKPEDVWGKLGKERGAYKGHRDRMLGN